MAPCLEASRDNRNTKVRYFLASREVLTNNDVYDDMYAVMQASQSIQKESSSSNFFF